MKEGVKIGKYFEELNVGDKWVSQGRAVSAADILIYAGIGGDYYEIHMNDEYARGHGFRERIAHGALSLTMTGGFLYQSIPLQQMIIANLAGTWTNPNPVYIGDTLYDEIEIVEKRESKTKSDRGIITFRSTVKNQNGQTVVLSDVKFMWRRKPQS